MLQFNPSFFDENSRSVLAFENISFEKPIGIFDLRHFQIVFRSICSLVFVN